MNMNEFLKMECAEKYDFTECTTTNAYRELSYADRFFAYHCPKVKNSTRFLNGAKKHVELEKQGVFKGLVDPDSECELVRDIYACLWDKTYLDSSDCGETMNSVNTTLDKFISLNEHENEKLKEFKTQIESDQNISIRYLINRFYDADGELRSLIEENNSLKNFMSIYHTIGNFIPFPKGCNQPRGMGAISDYWDLTLKYIYNYYHGDVNAIKNIYPKSKNEETFKDWLNKFVYWETFVEKNYMSPFVTENGEPKELWQGHFNGKILPETTDQCNEFFRNAYEWIIERGTLMTGALREKIKTEETKA